MPICRSPKSEVRSLHGSITRPQSRTTRGRPAHRRPAAHPCRRRLGQDARHRAAHRLSAVRRATRSTTKFLPSPSPTRRRKKCVLASRRCSARRSSGSWISTFHALCARLLRREATAIGLPRDFVIYDSSDQVALVKQVLKELQIDDSVVQPRMALSKISHAKNTMAGPGLLQVAGLEPARRAAREGLRKIHPGPAETTARSTSTTCC